MPKARILIQNKNGVFDPAGKVVQGGLERLGHTVSHVRVGKVIDLWFDSGTAAELHGVVDAMCKSLLVNPVIEDYTIEIEE